MWVPTPRVQHQLSNAICDSRPFHKVTDVGTVDAAKCAQPHLESAHHGLVYLISSRRLSGGLLVKLHN